MRSLEEIRNTPVNLLSDEEIGLLDPAGQEYAHKVKANMAKRAACPGHEPVSTGNYDDERRGWHPRKCKHCGTDMSYDSGD